MAASNSIINSKGDIGFLWEKQHSSFIWRRGHYTMLNQKFIDDYQLIELRYGRIISRGNSGIKVEFLRSHRELGYKEGQIVSLQFQTIKGSYLVTQQYIRIIPEDLPPVKTVAEKDKKNVRMIEPGGNRGESIGSVFRISIDEAERLLTGGFIELLPDNYIEPIPAYQDMEWISVKCIKPHPDFAYFPGGSGLILKSLLPKLLSGGYFDLTVTGNERAKILRELEIKQDPFSKHNLR